MKKIYCIIVGVLCLSFFLQCYFGAQKKSLTCDEPVFITAGYYHWHYKDFRIYQESPPLISKIISLPLLLTKTEFPSEQNLYFKQAWQDQLSYDFLDLNKQSIENFALLSRIPIMLCATFLVLVVFLWASKLYTPQAAIFAAACMAFGPNIIAHSKYATGDALCALTFLLALFSFWYSCKKKTYFSWILCGLITGTAIVIKFTAALLPLIFVLIGIVLIFTEKIKFNELLRGGFISGLLAYFVIVMTYNFDWGLSQFFIGLNKIYHNHLPNYYHYLLGEVYKGQKWNYFLILFCLKAPLILLVCIPLTVYLITSFKKHYDLFVFLVLPIMVVVITTSFDNANIGFRRILLILPLLYLCLAALYDHLRKTRYFYFLLLIMLVSLVDVIRVYPHHLSYFNLLSGGPKNGPYLADDSNLYWGQDLPLLYEWQKKSQDREKLLFLFSYHIDPSLYGINYVEAELEELVSPPKGYFVIDAHKLAWIRKAKILHPDLSIPDWLYQYQPIEVLGNTLYIYKF